MKRSEVHAESDTPTVRNSRKVIRAELETNCVGRDNATSGATLASRVPLSATTVRDVIAELRDDPAGPPIGSCADGYYVISDAAELDAYVESVRDEIRTKEERLQANVQAFNRRDAL